VPRKAFFPAATSWCRSDPENVGAVIRSAAAFGVTQVICLPKVLIHTIQGLTGFRRGGAAHSASSRAIAQDLPMDLPVIALRLAELTWLMWSSECVWIASRHRRTGITRKLASECGGHSVTRRSGIPERRTATAIALYTGVERTMRRHNTRAMVWDPEDAQENVEMVAWRNFADLH